MFAVVTVLSSLAQGAQLHQLTILHRSQHLGVEVLRLVTSDAAFVLVPRLLLAQNVGISLRIGPFSCQHEDRKAHTHTRLIMHKQ